MQKINENNIFIERLRSLMDEEGINITQLSLKTGIPRTTVNNWLNQGRSPKIEYLCALAKLFKCSADFLLGLEDELGNKKI